MPLPEGVIANRYWNSNGYGIAVAVCWEKATPDWAAYIGAQPDPVSEIATVEFAQRFGSKLEEHEVAALIPGIVEHMKERGLEYRR